MTDSFGGFNFGIGTHTPLWIFTDSSIGDEIPISVAGLDHTFNVSDELTYNLSDFGLVEVWVLEDLDFPGGFGWYEKSSGLLLNSTFLYEIGMTPANYSLTLVYSNYFEVEEEENGIPGYNLLLIIASLGVIILISAKVKFKKIKNF